MEKSCIFSSFFSRFWLWGFGIGSGKDILFRFILVLFPSSYAYHCLQGRNDGKTKKESHGISHE